MPIFLIFFGWLGCLLLAAVLFLARPFRSISVYLLLGSTGCFLGSLLLSTPLLLFFALFPNQLWIFLGILILPGYLGTMAVRGYWGAAKGISEARKLIQRFAWLQPGL
jgi:hypothetical protein